MNTEAEQDLVTMWVMCMLQRMVERGWLLPDIIAPDFVPTPKWFEVFDLQNESGEIPHPQDVIAVLVDIGYEPYKANHLVHVIRAVVNKGWEGADEDQKRSIGDVIRN